MARAGYVRHVGDNSSMPLAPLLATLLAAQPTSLNQARLLREIPLDATVHHVQGIVVEGATLWVTAVDAFHRRGFLHEFRIPDSGAAKLVRSVEIQRGARFHPGGLSADATSLWIPVAEYRRQSTATIERRDKRSLKLLSEFQVDDHIGCVAVRGDRVYGGNWDTLQIYEWDLAGKLVSRRDNPSGNSFQDLKAVGDRLVGGGGTRDGPAIDWLDAGTLTPVHRMKVGRTSRGAPFTREGLDLHGDRLYLLPEDDPSRLFVFGLEIHTP